LSSLNASAELLKSSEDNSTKKTKESKLVNKSEDFETKALELREKKLMLNSNLQEQELKNKHAALLTTLQELRWEKELLAEKFELKELKVKNESYERQVRHEQELESLEYEAKIKAIETEKINAKREMKKAEWDLEISKLQAELDMIEKTKERKNYVDAKPIYLENPLTKDNQLVISDRRILIEGVIWKKTADEITYKINYFNNKDSEKPIFLVIDWSPGGSAMAGYLILKAMKGSKAPIYVVLREYAASMAAIIVTLADKSFAYEHATILHHQPLMRSYGNLTEQEEKYKRLEDWWIEYGGATAKKMGITLEEFKKEMYKHNSSGDWSELAKNAKKLNWVTHIVDTMVETSILEEEVKEEDKKIKSVSVLNFEETINEKGQAIMYLPRLSPANVYFLHNPNKYYQFR